MSKNNLPEPHNKSILNKYYGVRYKGKIRSYISYELAVKKGLGLDTIKDLKTTYRKLYKTFDKIEECKDSKDIPKLIKDVEEIEFELQELWGFELDEKFHRYWMDCPGCSCPKMDNMDALGTGIRVTSSNCVLHGSATKQEGESINYQPDNIPENLNAYCEEEYYSNETCKEWITILAKENKSFKNNTSLSEKFLMDKQSFWEKNKETLEEHGFNYNLSLESALQDIKIMKTENLEGSLLVVSVGDEKKPASEDQIDYVKKMLQEVLDEVKGVRVLVTNTPLNIKKVSLPQLRKIESSILSSCDSSRVTNPILNIEL